MASGRQSFPNFAQMPDELISQDIRQRLKLAKKMSDDALSMMRKVGESSKAMASHHLPSDVRHQGAIIRDSFRQLMANQRIIMSELDRLEAAIDGNAELCDNEENMDKNAGRLTRRRGSRNKSLPFTGRRDVPSIVVTSVPSDR